MDKNKSICITGATGLVGSFLTVRALREGFKVILIVRNQNNAPGEKRVKNALLNVGYSGEEYDAHQTRIKIFDGELTKPKLGLAHEDWEYLVQKTFYIFHSAAYTCFDGCHHEIAEAVNIGGTKRILELTLASKAHLFAISTAYLGGQSHANLREKPLENVSEWRNIYEETKYKAEQLIHQYCNEHNIVYTVFRPSILIGSSADGTTTRFDTIYTFMKLLHELSSRRKIQQLVFNANPNATLNLIPIDFAIDTMWKIAISGDSNGLIFHITNPYPPKFARLAKIFETLFEEPIKLSVHQDKPRSNQHRILPEVPQYQMYLGDETSFYLSNTTRFIKDYYSKFPNLDEAFFRRLLAFALDRDWGKIAKKHHLTFNEHPQSNFGLCYFDHFLKSKINERLIENLRSLTAVVAIDLEDEKESSRVLKLVEGKLISITQNTVVPECTYTLDTSTFKSIVQGELQPQQAFFEGKVSIQGDMEKGLQAATALSEFFQKYPYQLEATM